MSSLVGFVAFDPLDAAAGASLLSRMLDALGGRGPDPARGTAVGPDFGVGIRRPRDGLRQPYRSPSGDFVAGWTGHPLTVEPDGSGVGEQLRRLYDLSEENLVPELEAGAFTLAVWDGRARRLLLARDGHGQAPLVYGWSRDRRLFLFASEAKALLATRKVDAVIDGRAMLDVLSAGYPFPPRTLFSGIEPLRPRTWLTLDVRGRLRKGQVPAREAASDPPLRERLEARLAVLPRGSACHLEDGPSAAALAHLLAPREVSLFVGAFEGVDTGAARFAERVARRLEADLAVVPYAPVDETSFLEVLRALETPPLTSEPFFNEQIFEALARDGRREVVVADGAEAFFGAEGFRRAHRFRALGAWMETWTWRAVPGLARSARRARAAVPRYRRRWGAAPVSLERWALRAHCADGLFRSSRRPPQTARWPSYLPAAPLLTESGRGRQARLYISTELSSWELHWRDRVSSRHGVARIAPFLDVAACPEPSRDDATLRGLLPRRLGVARRRGRRAFVHPNPVWPFGPGTPRWVATALSGPSLDRLGVFDAAAVARTLEHLLTRRDEVARLEAEVMRGVLGLVLLAQLMGVEGVSDYSG